LIDRYSDNVDVYRSLCSAAVLRPDATDAIRSTAAEMLKAVAELSNKWVHPDVVAKILDGMSAQRRNEYYVDFFKRDATDVSKNVNLSVAVVTNFKDYIVKSDEVSDAAVAAAKDCDTRFIAWLKSQVKSDIGPQRKSQLGDLLMAFAGLDKQIDIHEKSKHEAVLRSWLRLVLG
jgi:uncharacterized protein YqeY